MFSPYHSFGNCVKLKNRITALKTRAAVPIAIEQGHNLYHMALEHKLKSAYRYLENLKKTGANFSVEDSVDPTEFIFEANFNLDGFFYCCGSSLDILAREILVYFAVPLPANVYYNTAYETIYSQRPGDSLLPFLKEPSWKKEFSGYRNATAHEVLLTIRFNLTIEVSADHNSRRIEIPLPDDPKKTVRKYRRNKDSILYCETLFKRLLRHANAIYGETINRIDLKGSLPL